MCYYIVWSHKQNPSPRKQKPICWQKKLILEFILEKNNIKIPHAWCCIIGRRLAIQPNYLQTIRVST